MLVERPRSRPDGVSHLRPSQALLPASPSYTTENTSCDVPHSKPATDVHTSSLERRRAALSLAHPGAPECTREPTDLVAPTGAANANKHRHRLCADWGPTAAVTLFVSAGIGELGLPEDGRHARPDEWNDLT